MRRAIWGAVAGGALLVVGGLVGSALVLDAGGSAAASRPDDASSLELPADMTAGERTAAASPAPAGGEPEAVAPAPAEGALLSYEDGLLDRIADLDGEVVLYFHSDRFAACERLRADLLAEGVPAGLTVVTVDFDGEPGLRERYGVQVPATAVYLDSRGDELASAVLQSSPTVAALVGAAPLG